MFGRNEITGDQKPSRIHYPWNELEEYSPNGGMWQIPSLNRRNWWIERSSELMVDRNAFAAAMRLALKKWPKSVAVALTTEGMNQRAWLGHAGCFLAVGSPEETTRLGWHQLDPAEQYAANDAADQVIAEWVQANRPKEVPGQLSFLDGI